MAWARIERVWWVSFRSAQQALPSLISAIPVEGEERWFGGAGSRVREGAPELGSLHEEICRHKEFDALARKLMWVLWSSERTLASFLYATCATGWNGEWDLSIGLCGLSVNPLMETQGASKGKSKNKQPGGVKYDATRFNCVLAFLSSSALPPLPGPETVEPRLNRAGDSKYNVKRNPHAFPDSKLLRDAVVETAEVRLLTLGRLQLLVLCMTRTCRERREESLACMEGEDGRRPYSQRCTEK
ncbi:hypothetical protein B0H14DRAFT_3158093 [Mycena olivaceomarginata]|nr:hypothetical protein B0H14DRAFT_3158093 [Mycena olivaceomarginata]